MIDYKEISSKRYFARLKIKKDDKDGEYYDIVFGEKGQKNHAHFGIKVVSEDGKIGGKVFFTQARDTVSKHTERTYNQKTGELISEIETPFTNQNDKKGAELHYSVRYDENEKKAYLTNFEIIEFDSRSNSTD